jgi:hypothetical protein
MIADGNLDIHKGVKSTENDNCMGKYKRYFYYGNLFKDNLLFQQK